MDAVGRLAGGVAHDFNNLLTIITSYSELALDSVVPGSPTQFRVQEILSAARRAADLTRQLLAFSRQQPQALRVAELNPVLNGIAKMLHRLIGEDIELVYLPGNGLGRVRLDPVQILDRESVLARRIRSAIDRIEGGAYGICLECEEEISPRRLNALPWAELCIHCQERADELDSQRKRITAYGYSAEVA